MTMSFNNTSDEYWAEKLRRENCDQFNTLVRMHLSFVLDLNTDDNECVTEKAKFKKWSFVPFAKKPKNMSRGVMDGAPLTQEGICQVYQLIEYLSKEPNICAEGIFRRTGSLTRQQELRALLNQGQSLELDGGRYSVHDCASVLKGFLAELPEPLFTDAHYPAHCQIAELCSSLDKPSVETRLLRALQLLLLLLPSENRVLLRDVLQLLNETASRECSNKMSADSLATLFTPHLLCPRRLTPEALHAGSQQLSGIVAFMIRRGVSLFRIPPKLAVDIRAYFTEAGHNAAASSDSDGPAASTVYSFVDRERTAQAHSNNPTEAALAQLYAYIQGLPESSKKRKLVKQFNKENGNGTPLHTRETHRSPHHTRPGMRSKSLGDSIKRHIFQKGLTKAVKRGGVNGAVGGTVTQLRSSSEEVLTSPNCVPLTARARLFCVDCETSSDSELNPPSGQYRRLERSVSSPGNLQHTTDEEHSIKANLSIDIDGTDKRLSDDERIDSDEIDSPVVVSYLTSTPAVTRVRRGDVRNVFTPGDYGRKSMSPITRSTQKMSKAMQESMMTPRSRKPVLLMSGTNICALPELHLVKRDSISSLEEETEDSLSFDTGVVVKCKSDGDVKPIRNAGSTRTDPADSLTSTFREYLCSRSILADTNPVDASFSSRTDDYDSTDSDSSVPEECLLSDSLLFCMDGNRPAVEADSDDSENENCGRKRNASGSYEGDSKRYMVDKQPFLKPKQFNEDGEPIMFETSF